MFRRLLSGRSKADSLAQAVKESQARLLAGQCEHQCVSCDYFHTVAHISESITLLRRAEAVLEDHLQACATGAPNSSSCRIHRPNP